MTRQEVENFYNPRIENVERIIANMNLRGLDPRNFYDAMNNELLNLPSILDQIKLEKAKQLAIITASEAIGHFPFGIGKIF
ncbi:hypothetical protein HDF26_003300 [Pedobacter cryoconitis]|uniref:Uncharacterized protein n=1 Tax=Pedobacter cryoconitis TaxID=188932 RepID=A0A7W8ZLZ2_9SPHI|nr:hypothetical protein [Pedobacter cryoconitis]MBB5636242.1 hypothetical protein [Pedobacter cryoconitis]MBB6272840.1 hypothetical protein [Pedobacter cryoconitis]